MGFVMPHMMVLIGLGVIGVSLLLEVVGLATTGWLVAGPAEYGLFKICAKDVCADWPVKQDWLDACRAFGILAVLAMAASLGAALLIGFMSEQKIFTLLAPVAAAAGAFCALIEFAVFAGETESFFGKGAKDYLDYSFALSIVAMILSAAAAVLFLLGRSRMA